MVINSPVSESITLFHCRLRFGCVLLKLEKILCFCIYSVYYAFTATRYPWDLEFFALSLNVNWTKKSLTIEAISLKAILYLANL